MEKTVGIIIPARYDSSRLPGKPLLDLNGKSMIQRTWERSIMALPAEQVYIATDSDKIASHVESFGAKVVMTPSSCLTGTDRVAEANRQLKLDLVINVQGDEPIIDPADITKVIDFSKKNPNSVVNAYAGIKSGDEYFSLTIPKLAKSKNDDLLYMSRAPIPGGKTKKFDFAYKQICIYAFPKEKLEQFYRCETKSPFERVEDIEILRFLEMGVPVKLVAVSGNSMAVDTEKDAAKVIKFLQKTNPTSIRLDSPSL